MGGYGSGWRRPRRATVEESLTLELAWLRERGLFVPGEYRSGLVSWSAGGQERNAIHCCADLRPGVRPVLVLRYRAGIEAAADIEYGVPLETTPQAWGGVRWWLCCPLGVDGQVCGRRVTALHSPPGQHYFGCRHCFGLTYESCRESHKWDSLYKRLGVDTGLDAAMIRKGMKRRGW